MGTSYADHRGVNPVMGRRPRIHSRPVPPSFTEYNSALMPLSCCAFPERVLYSCAVEFLPVRLPWCTIGAQLIAPHGREKLKAFDNVPSEFLTVKVTVWPAPISLPAFLPIITTVADNPGCWRMPNPAIENAGLVATALVIGTSTLRCSFKNLQRSTTVVIGSVQN